MTEKEVHEGQGARKEPYIRERIVPRKSWKDYFLKALTGVLIAAVLGISVGIGIAFISPALQKLFGAQETEPDDLGDSSASDENDGGTHEMESTRETEQNTVHETLSSEESSLSDADYARIYELFAQYHTQQVLDSGDIARFSEALQSVYTEVNTAFLPLTIVPKASGVTQEVSVSALVVQMTGSHVSLLTDQSVLETAGSMYVTVDGQKYTAAVTAVDTITGLTLLAADLSGADITALSAVTPVSQGSSETLSAGDVVIAAGNPLGFAGSTVCGMVTGLEYGLSEQDMTFTVIYTDMPSAGEGNAAGGFLFNIDGELIGWLTADNSFGGAAAQTVMTAVGIDDLKDLLADMLAGNDTAYLGIQGQTISQELAEENELAAGVYVREVVSDGPAYAAGIQSGDIICAVNGETVLIMEDLEAVVCASEAQEIMEITLMRWSRNGYAEMKISVTAGSRLKWYKQ